MNAKLNEAIIKATKETFAAMIGSDIQNGQPVEQKMNGQQVDTSIIISFVGSLTGAFTMRCSKALGGAIASKMLGSEIDPDSDDMKDAVGELFNMIVGATKTHYDSSSDPFKMSVPTTVVGGDYTVHIKAATDATVALIPFTYEGTDLNIEVFLS